MLGCSTRTYEYSAAAGADFGIYYWRKPGRDVIYSPGSSIALQSYAENGKKKIEPATNHKDYSKCKVGISGASKRRPTDWAKVVVGQSV